MSIAATLRAASERLAAVSETPRLDAELLLVHALGISRNDLLLRQHELETPESIEALLARRLSHEPVAHIVGTRDFWTLTLRVTPDVLIPRPDSETLIEAAIEHFRGSPGPTRILDLGTGSGALLLAALDQWPEATGLGIDISPAALAVAQGNAANLGLAARADFRIGNWTEGLAERFDLILINPPYIATAALLSPEVMDHEPHGALFAGEDGLADYRRLAPQLAGVLAPAGLAVIEIGFDQGESAAALFRQAGFRVAVRHDLAGHDRCLEVGHQVHQIR